jgi:hypothetical protein
VLQLKCGTAGNAVPTLLMKCGTQANAVPTLLRACPSTPSTLCGYDTILATVSGFSSTGDCKGGPPYVEGGKFKYPPYHKVVFDSMPVVLSQPASWASTGCADYIDHPDCQFAGRIGTLEWWQLIADTEEELEALTCNDAVLVGGEAINLVVSAIAAPASGVYKPYGKNDWAIYSGTYPSGIFKAWCLPSPFWKNSWPDHVNFGPVLQPDPGATEPYVSMVLQSTAPAQAWTLIESSFSGSPVVTLENS